MTTLKELTDVADEIKLLLVCGTFSNDEKDILYKYLKAVKVMLNNITADHYTGNNKA